MKNVLYVGPYLQNDGWGYAAREYIRALRNVCNLTIRPIYLNKQKSYNKFEEFNELENNGQVFDTIIQHCLPHMFKRYGNVKNIGLAFFESFDLESTPWPLAIRTMVDELWVCSQFECINLSPLPSTKVVPIPTDINKYNKQYEYKPFDGMEYEYKFYFVGEYISRKNIGALIIAFHREFNTSENVRLVIKTNKGNTNAHSLYSLVNRDIENIKNSTKLAQNHKNLKKEIIVSNYLSEEELLGLHQKCDCFVMPSYGEAFCIPAFDAMAFGKTPIVNKNSSMKDYILDGKNGYLVESHKIPAISYDRPLEFLYTGRDTWYEVDILDLQEKMRTAYNNRSNEYDSSHLINRYSYSNVGQIMRDLL